MTGILGSAANEDELARDEEFVGYDPEGTGVLELSEELFIWVPIQPKITTKERMST
jgi:hypothetical protein